MGTSLRDLLLAYDAITRPPDAGVPTMAAADDAAAALAPLGRGLHRLAIDGIDRYPSGVRERAVTETAAACRAAGAGWRDLPTGRLTDLAGAISDQLGQLRFDATRTERWAAAVRLTVTARRSAALAAAHPQYCHVPELAQVRHTAAMVRLLAASTPPPRHQQILLDRSLPRPDADPATAPTRRSADAAITLVDDLRHAAQPGRPGLTLAEAIAVMRGCETAARYAIVVLDPAALPPPARHAADAWRAAWTSLTPFDDGTRAHPDPYSPISRHATQIPDGLYVALGPGHAVNPAAARGDATVMSDLQTIVNHLPLAAEHLDTAVQRWASTGQLRGRADKLLNYPNSPRRTYQRLIHAIITADHGDLAPTVHAIRSAGLLTAALATHLAHTAQAGAPAHPHLTAAYTARITGPAATSRLTNATRDAQRHAATTRATPSANRPRPT